MKAEEIAEKKITPLTGVSIALASFCYGANIDGVPLDWIYDGDAHDMMPVGLLNYIKARA